MIGNWKAKRLFHVSLLGSSFLLKFKTYFGNSKYIESRAVKLVKNILFEDG